MSDEWTLDDLARWEDKIRQHVDAFGLNCFDQEFEVCDHEQMIGFMAYHGMPAHYPHWSYGKNYERQKTFYDLQISGLPYEMVINSDPSVAYLMRGNSLCLQILTMAHVYGHNDFFKNNFTFNYTDPTGLLARIKVHGSRVRDYIADPSIGLKRVEPILDACHALTLQVNRNQATRRLSRSEQETNIVDRFVREEKTDEVELALALEKEILEPEYDLLRLIIDHAPDLSDWERDLVNIVHQESLYFVPQIETKIINEGWASFWHHQIMNALDLPDNLRLEFMVRHNQVIRPNPGAINPYHLGFMTWRKIAKEALGLSDKEDDGGPLPLEGEQAKHVREKLFQIREVDRDVSFLRRFLDENLMRDLDIFEFADNEAGDTVINKVADEDNWQVIKETLLKQVGMAGIPVIKAVDINIKDSHILTLQHEHDMRELEIENARETMKHLFYLWRRPVELETFVEEKLVRYRCNEDGFEVIN